MVKIGQYETHDTGFIEATEDNWSDVEPPSDPDKYFIERKYNGAGLPPRETYQETLTLSRNGPDFVVILEKGSELVYSVIRNEKLIYLKGNVHSFPGSGT